MPTPKTLLINSAECPVVSVTPFSIGGFRVVLVLLNGRPVSLPHIPVGFGPGSAVNIDSLFIQWGS